MRKKRKRGGQKGNQNARKHGFYSVNLSPREICELWNIVNLEGIDPPVGVLRIKLCSALHRDPENHRVLSDASRLLAKWYGSQYHLNEKDNVEIKKFVRTILKATANGDKDLTERIVAESLENA
jgi:hypothetical protein